MERIPFGRSGVDVSAVGLGCGGYSRLGAGSGQDADNARRVIRAAADLGVTFFDTSPSYENEEIVGSALAPVRDRVLLSTKFSTLNRDGAPIDGAALRRSLEASLRRLGTDHVDVFSIQSVTPATYEHCYRELLPELLQLRKDGLVRMFGLTEWFFDDTTHRMAERAVHHGYWDYLLVGFNILNQSARTRVLEPASEMGIATAVMFAVRRVLADPDLLTQFIAALVETGDLDPDLVDADDPFGFVFEESDCTTLTEAGYRFCRHESPGSVVLTGTGSVEHLEQNIAAINRPPLPAPVSERLRRIFAGLDAVTAQETVDSDGRIVRRLVEGKPRGH